MRQTIYYLLLLIITLSCTEKKTQSNNNKINKNSKSDTVSKIEESSKEKSNSDCIFDDNYKVVTKEWLDELGIKKYVWDPKNNRAIVAYNGDTLTLYQGGCYHFVSSVEISTALYPNKETDSTLLKKINDVACKFKFDNYCQKLVEGKFKRVDNDDASVLLEFEDDDPEDNIIYGGIQILEKEKKTIVKITEYYN